ncbi:MAG: ABC transporter substrate-binding protein [Planctomycetes bacterium]|nr:ABC transporter substrate-binding protein [Planctomycetota bacterium]
MRIVSTTCSNTEIVCALGRAGWLVGVDRHSDHPPEVVARLPRVGPDLGVDPEAVASLRPDLVLASRTVPGHDRVVASLENRGLRVVAPAPRSLHDVYRDITEIGDLLEARGAAERLVASMRDAIPTPAPRVESFPGILVEWWPKPVIVPGRDSWVTDLLAAARARNPWSDAPVESRPVSDEEVRQRNPAAVVIAWCGVDPAKYRPSEVGRRPWSGVRAVESGQIHMVPEAFLGRPGPRLVEGYRALDRIARGL